MLDFLRGQEPLEKISLKALTLKAAVLLAITSAARAHELAALDLDSCLKKTMAWEFTTPEHVKNSRAGHPPRRLYLPAFPKDSTICVVRTLEVYVKRTSELRKSRKLLVSYIAPHDCVGSQTISRRLTQTIHGAGIPVAFTGHSIRGASTSAAAAAGVPLELVLEAGDWSSAQVFEKHYHISTDRTAFVAAVLDN